MVKYSLTHTGQELDEAMGIFMSGQECGVGEFELFAADLSDPTGADIRSGAVDTVIGAMVSG